MPVAAPSDSRGPSPPHDSATAYARAVVAGELVAGRLVQLACARHLRDFEHGHARRLRFDVDLAEEAIEFFEHVRHSKGEWAGTPVVLSPPEQFIIGALFGWVDAVTRLRRFRTAYVEVAKKFGKSLIASGVGLFLAFYDGEPGAEVYAAASKRDQAKIVWGEARAMVMTTPELRRRIQVRALNLHHLDTASKFEPLGRDSEGLDGINPHGKIIDELHRHKTREVWDILEQSSGSRRQPLTFVITTAGADTASICWEQHDYAVKVLEGVLVDDTYFAYVATLDVCESCRAKGRTAPDDTCSTCDAWTDERAWPKANPNYPITPKPDEMRQLCRSAQERPAAQNAFKRLRLNIWTESVERWLPADAWRACGEPLRPLAGRRGVLGLDLSSTMDLTALVGVFEADDGTYDVTARFWLPGDNLAERVKRDRAPYDVWAREGYLTLTDGSAVDYDFIVAEILAIPEREGVEIAEVAYDPWNATSVSNDLEQAGVARVPIRQGFASLNAPSKALETLIAKRQIRHGGHPLLALCAANTIVEIDAAGNIKPSKAKSHPIGRIDGIVALVTALARVIVQPDTRSVYATRGVLVV